MPRASEYTQAVADAICDRLAEGESLRAICRDEGMPAISTVFKWLGKPENAPFVEQYARAREEQAENDADKVTDLGDRCARGEIDPQAARVAIDAAKWSAGKRLPKKYGDKIQQEVSGPGGGPIETKTELSLRPPLTREEWLAAHGLG